ncbi:MAG: C10 family peptidase [Bacteroidia bacterium]
MKKLITLLTVCTFGFYSAKATPVGANVAQKVATNFFSSISKVAITQVSLAYTETGTYGNALYYVFNINASDGFVIVTADDAMHPIIGYSTEKRPYVIPGKGTNIDFWMNKRKNEIISNQAGQVKATPYIAYEWASYINGVSIQKADNTKRPMSSKFPSSSVYLVQSTWNQESPYYDDCPGGSVTGCVATAMCQIMRYWQYPSTGLGSSSYCDCSPYYSENYGTLYANFDYPFAWSAMTLTNPSTTDTNLARAMYDAGVSVQMDYSPTGSGAIVLAQDAGGGPCAQTAYVQYFNYSPNILDGQYEFSDTVAWQDTLEHELDCNRPIEYQGTDPSQGGHTWVCDGYDANNYFHMNWGWGGEDNGWFPVGSLTPAGTGLNFSQYLGALLGIMPPPATAAPIASFTSSAKATCVDNTVQFIDISSNQPTSWSWTFTGGTPSASTLQNPTVTYTVSGTYPVTLVATNSFGNNSVTMSGYITVNALPPAPTVVQSGDTLICTPAGYTYAWYKSGVLIAGETSDKLVISAKGVYVVKLSNSDGCTTSTNFVVKTVTGINEITSLNDFVNVFPNPTAGNLQVVFNLPSDGNYRISISNVLGQSIYTNNLRLVGEYVQNIDLSGYAKGMYFLSVEGADSKGVKKILLY